MPATEAIETMAPFRCGRMRLIASAAQRNMPVRCVLRTAVPVGVAHLLRKRDALDAGIVDQHVDPAGLAVDRREGGGDAAAVGDVAGEVVDAGVARLGLAEVEREDRRRPRRGTASAMASPMPRAAPVTTATLPSNARFAAMARLPRVDRRLNTSASRR